MRELAFNEVNHISGGNAVVGAWVAGALLVGLIGSYAFSKSYHVKYEPYTHVYEVITPVYDPKGVYVGDIVDTYEEVKYKPIYY